MRSRLYIGHLSSDTTEATLRAWLSVHGLVIDGLRVPVNRATGVARGFAFAEFANADGAYDAVAALRGLQLDGHIPVLRTVELSYSPVESRK